MITTGQHAPRFRFSALSLKWFSWEIPRALRVPKNVLQQGTVALFLGWLLVVPSLEAAIVVRTDQAVYNVMPGETFQIDVHIDQDDQTLGPAFEPLPNGLFSNGVMLAYPVGLATIPTVADITPVADLDYFGFTPGAMENVTVNSAMVKGNINQTLAIPYFGSLLASFQITNLAAAPSSYLVNLDEWRTLGPTEQIFVDGAGIVLDTVPSTNLFRNARINVIPEPNGWLMVLGIAFALTASMRHCNVTI